MAQTDCNCAALRQATRFVTRFYDDALAPVGLGINQYSILARLDRLGPTVLQALARALVMDRSTLGHLIRPLQARGLVSLGTTSGDGRCRMLSVTVTGRALLAQARPLWDGAQARFEGGFGAGEAGALRAALLKLLALPLDASPGGPPAPGSHRPTDSLRTGP